MIVSNTTPLTNLLRLGLLPELGRLFPRIVVLPEVLAELEVSHGSAETWRPPDGVLGIEVRQAAPSELALELALRLDSGEIAAICLSVEVGAGALLIDEDAGRQAARRHGIKVVGTLAILVELKKLGLVDNLDEVLHRLRHELHFWFSDELREWAMREAEGPK